LLCALLCLPSLAGAQMPTTTADFFMPGTQPLSILDGLSTPDDCTPCHSDYGSPEVEPFRNWEGSMMGQAARDPLMWAAVAIANQDADNGGEPCLRCHVGRGWLEGRSAAPDGSMMTADDRHGVQCSVCHRMVDPTPGPGAPAEDAAILAALTEPVVVTGSAQMIIDPEERLRGPFDVEADLGFNPHAPASETLVSPYHQQSEMCGTCHNVYVPLYSRDLSGEYVANAVDEPGDPALSFPEQNTYSEWLYSDYATGTVHAPQFGGNKTEVSTCQDCHMPDVSGIGALDAGSRDDLPLHQFLGANTFALSIIPHHPVFGPEVDAELLLEGAERNRDFLRKAATVTATITTGQLTVRVQNETGHKLPTGYPEGRRMWLHVRAYDEDRNVVFESGRYDFAEAQLPGVHAELGDPDYDASLHTWETLHGTSPALAALLGIAPGTTQHLTLANVREHDNRIPPRGWVKAQYDAVDATPIPDDYPEGQYWEDVVYPVGAGAVKAEVSLYYQTATREYIEFLRDENVTNAAGPILYDLWNTYNRSLPVEMARVVVETDEDKLARCSLNSWNAGSRYFKNALRQWRKCFYLEAGGLTCDGSLLSAKLATARGKLESKLGGAGDKSCAGAGLTPASLGHPGWCPAPCAGELLFDASDLADCNRCLADQLVGAAMESAYGVTPPSLPAASGPGTPDVCQRALASASTSLSWRWTKELARCEKKKLKNTGGGPLDCNTDPEGRIARAAAKSARRIVKRCDDTGVLPGCASGNDAAAAAACVEAAVSDLAPAMVSPSFADLRP